MAFTICDICCTTRRYFIDEKARRLYFMPPEGQVISAKPVMLSVNHSAVVGLAAGTAHVQFVGLTVGFGRKTGIAASSVDNVLVQNCTVRISTIGCYSLSTRPCDIIWSCLMLLALRSFLRCTLT